jgi:predicted nucleic acid-binding protein
LVIADLKGKIEAQTKVTDELTQRIDEEKKINRVEEEKFRKLAQMNAALQAKLEFI